MIDEEVRTFTLDPAEVVRSDNMDPSPTVTYSPETLTISKSFIGVQRDITVTVTDNTNRRDQCIVQVYTAGEQVSLL